jgi:hypothetical protein
MLKFTCIKKLKTKNSAEYFIIIQEVINFSQKNMYANASQKTKSNILKAIHIDKKFF